MGNYQLTAIIELLNPDNTISAHRMLAHAIGMTETIIYSSLISKQTYYSQNGMLYEDGWFYSTTYDLQESTTFGSKAQKTAINHLIAHGLIECEYKGLPAKRYFRIINDTDTVMKLIDEGVKISRKIVSGAKEHNAEKRSTKDKIFFENASESSNAVSAKNIVEEDVENAANDITDSTYPSAGTCTHLKAGTCSSPAQGKSKDNIKPNIDNPELNKSIDRSAQKEKIESSPERKPLKFSEVMDELGIDWYDLTANEPESETHFCELDEACRKTKHCKIPYTLKNDRQAMTAALKYLSAYSYFFADSSDLKEKEFFGTVLSAIAEMTEPDSITVAGARVMYYEIIDRLNEIISQSYLSEWLFSFEEKWKSIVTEKDIKHPRAYMKTCIWNWLKDFEFENYNTEEKYAAEIRGW